MSSDEEQEPDVPMPRHRVRFSDMSQILQEKAIRCKSPLPPMLPMLFTC